jgi:hypothetical protein
MEDEEAVEARQRASVILSSGTPFSYKGAGDTSFSQVDM